MTKRKLLNQNVLFFLISLLGLFIFSCKNPLAQSQENQLSKETVKLKISTNFARTVLPTQFNAKTPGLTWTLTGIKDGASTSTKLGSWSDDYDGAVSKFAYSKMTSTEISVDVGTWDFTLDVTNSSGEKVLTGTTGSINVSTNSTLTFVMQEPTEGDVAPGQIKFTLTFPAETVDNVVATLTEYGKTNEQVNPQPFTPLPGETEDSVTYTNTVSAGTYMLKLDLQQEDPAVDSQQVYRTINTYTCLIRVAPGLLSKGSDKLNSLAKLYKIKYELDNGTMPESVTPTSYNQYTKFELPNPTKDGYIFLGWCTDSSCTGESCDQLKVAGTTISISEDTTLYAKWQEQTPEPSNPTNGLLYFSNNENGGNIDCLEISTTEGLNAYRDYINGTTTNLQVAYKNNNGQTMTFSGNSGRIDACLMTDITVDNWIPIGKNGTSTYFEFEGNNYTITINSIDSSSEYVGVFGYVGNTTATNLKIKNLTVAGTISTEKQYAGGIVAYSNGATIENCVNKLQITGNDSNTIVGGIVGYSQKETAINNCVNFAKLTSTFVVGGIVGTASFVDNTDYTLTLSKCINLGQITGSAGVSYISGMVANSNVSADISNCINIGQINVSSSPTGGPATLTGFIYLIKNEPVTPLLTIKNCINTNNEPTGYVTNSIFVGNSNGTIGQNSNLYYDSTKWASSGNQNDPNSIIKTGKTTADLCNLNSEDLSNEWSFAEAGEDARYPLPDLSKVNETVWSAITSAEEVVLPEIEVPEEIPGIEVTSLTELSDAIADTAIDVIVIAADIKVTETLNIKRDVTILANEDFTLIHSVTSDNLFWIAPETECVFTLGGGAGELIITGDANFAAITTNSSKITINIKENVTFTGLDHYAISVVNKYTTLNINGGKFDYNNSLPIYVSASAIIKFNSGSISNNSFSGSFNSASIYLQQGTLTIGEEAICKENRKGTNTGSLIWVGSSATATLNGVELPTNTLYEKNIGE